MHVAQLDLRFMISCCRDNVPDMSICIAVSFAVWHGNVDEVSEAGDVVPVAKLSRNKGGAKQHFAIEKIGAGRVSKIIGSSMAGAKGNPCETVHNEQ